MTVDEELEQARARIARWHPWEALDPLASGAILVDIRPREQRELHGELPVGIVVERNVLEWRLDPTSPWRITRADGYDRIVIIVCQEGYASSLAAASLRDLGYRTVGDVVGGVEAWKTAGLPVRSARQETNAVDDSGAWPSRGSALSPSSAFSSGMHRWRGPMRSRPPSPRISSSR